MCIYERVGLIAFITMLVIVYTPTLVILGRRYVLKPKTMHLWERAVLGVAALGIVLMAYGYFIEPYWVEVTHRTIISSKLGNLPTNSLPPPRGIPWIATDRFMLWELPSVSPCRNFLQVREMPA